MGVQLQTDSTLVNTPLNLPYLRAVYERVSSRIVDLARLEQDIAERIGFHGTLEFQTAAGSYYMFYLDSKRVSSGWLDSSFEAVLLGTNDMQGNLSLHAMDRNPAAILSKLERGETIRLDSIIPALGLRETLARCFDAKASGWLRVQDAYGNSGSLLIGQGQVLHAHSSLTAQSDFAALIAEFVGSEGISASLQLSDPLPSTVDFALRRSAPAQILEAWSQVLQRTRTITDRSSTGIFDRLWREVGLQLADSYPILDPFMADLTWRNSQLELHCEAPDDLLPSIVTAYAACLQRVRLSPEVLFDHIDMRELSEHYRGCGLEQAFGRHV